MAHEREWVGERRKWLVFINRQGNVVFMTEDLDELYKFEDEHPNDYVLANVNTMEELQEATKQVREKNADLETGYRLDMSPRQARVILNALDTYSRIGIGQFQIVVETIQQLFGWDIDQDAQQYTRDCLDVAKKLILGLDPNASYGIPNQKDVSELARIAYDLHCVLRRQVAINEQHDRWTTWHGTPLHTAPQEPLAVARVIAPQPESEDARKALRAALKAVQFYGSNFQGSDEIKAGIAAAESTINRLLQDL